MIKCQRALNPSELWDDLSLSHFLSDSHDSWVETDIVRQQADAVKIIPTQPSSSFPFCLHMHSALPNFLFWLSLMSHHAELLNHSKRHLKFMNALHVLPRSVSTPHFMVLFFILASSAAVVFFALMKRPVLPQVISMVNAAGLKWMKGLQRLTAPSGFISVFLSLMLECLDAAGPIILGFCCIQIRWICPERHVDQQMRDALGPDPILQHPGDLAHNT